MATGTPLPFLILLVISTKLGLAVAAPQPVFDIRGEKLQTGVDYYILPATRGGGLTLASTRNKTCPNYVIQEHGKGLPLTFTPVDPEIGIIPVSTDLNIKFSSHASCNQSTVWKLLKELTGVWFVSGGGVEGNPGIGTIVNWFKIEKADAEVYKLAFCPTVCKDCRVICDDLGIYIDESGKRHLSLADKVQPLRVMFMKASIS